MPPPDEPGPRWQQLTAHATHFLLYGFILAIPLSGWWFNSLHGYPLQWFKLFNLPSLADKNPDLAHFAHGVHKYLFLVITRGLDRSCGRSPETLCYSIAITCCAACCRSVVCRIEIPHKARTYLEKRMSLSFLRFGASLLLVALPRCHPSSRLYRPAEQHAWLQQQFFKAAASMVISPNGRQLFTTIRHSWHRRNSM